MKSIITEIESCFLCGREWDLETHHCIHGTANRKLADKYGLTVPLCMSCHRNIHDRRNDLDRFLMCTAQEAFEAEHGTREDFMRIFGKNYRF